MTALACRHPGQPIKRSATREAVKLRRQGLLVGTGLEDGREKRLPETCLQTSIHVVGATGSGKSRWQLWTGENLMSLRHATIIGIDAKPGGELYRMSRDWAITHGQVKRLSLLDLTDPELPVGYNPLEPNGLTPAMHAKALREAIRSIR